MARDRFTVRSLLPILGVAVLVLGGLCVWLAATRTPRPPAETPHHMAQRQIRAERGADWEVRYIESDAGPVVCGYAAPRNRAGMTHEPVAFISRIGRVMFADDPLPTEFRDLRDRYCPGFARAPSAPNYVNSAPTS
ncbi:hypothetical protein [Brevundimonas sp. NIBR11]|uniref:hypothetical protein n=1 Tax=Brevundimonas sp. NIBR11 TaxID=3015999 RepID=UPI0022F0541C|nr:hypothetical protein [Brevundimonas sp. NIBR11]WGM32156.1 hypothetical protein KKHFBJBL_02407 [Brevundimonas sp. NIBR11]